MGRCHAIQPHSLRKCRSSSQCLWAAAIGNRFSLAIKPWDCANRTVHPCLGRTRELKPSLIESASSIRIDSLPDPFKPVRAEIGINFAISFCYSRAVSRRDGPSPNERLLRPPRWLSSDAGVWGGRPGQSPPPPAPCAHATPSTRQLHCTTTTAKPTPNHGTRSLISPIALATGASYCAPVQVKASAGPRPPCLLRACPRPHRAPTSRLARGRPSPPLTMPSPCRPPQSPTPHPSQTAAEARRRRQRQRHRIRPTTPSHHCPLPRASSPIREQRRRREGEAARRTTRRRALPVPPEDTHSLLHPHAVARSSK